MLKAEVGRECGVRVETTGECTKIADDVLNIIQAIYCSMLKLRGGEQQAEMFRCYLAIGISPDSPVWHPIQMWRWSGSWETVSSPGRSGIHRRCLSESS